MANKSFPDWFDELCNGNQIWAESVSMHHKPKTFEDCAKRVYDQYLAADPAPFPPMQVARGYVGNVIAKVNPDKTYSKDWATKALQKMEVEKKEEWIPLTGEQRAQKLKEWEAIVKGSTMLNSMPKPSYKALAEEGGVLPPKPAPYPITTPEEAYVRDRHFEWVKNNFEAKTGYKLPSWIDEESWNIVYDDQHLTKSGK